MPKTIMGLETRACINGLSKSDFENVKQIPILESETEEIKNTTIPSLDERITALEQGGSGGKEYELQKINIDNILNFVDHDEESYFFNTDIILNLEFLTGTIEYDNLTRPYYFNNYQKIFYKNEIFTGYHQGMTEEQIKEYIISMLLYYKDNAIPISLPKQDSGLKAIGIAFDASDPRFNSQSNYYEQTIKGYIIINDTNLTFKEVTGKIVFEEFSVYVFTESE